MSYDKTISEKIMDAMNEDRLLVLLECKGGFRQVLLDPTQLKKVSDAIIVSQTTPDIKGNQDVELNLDDERLLPLSLFEGMASHY